MSSASLVMTTPVESVLRWHVKNLPPEYQQDFEFAVYNPIDERLIGNIWSLKWDGQQAYLI